MARARLVTRAIGRCASAPAEAAEFWDYYAVRARGQRGSNDGSQVVRVFHAIEQDDQAVTAAAGIGALEDIVERTRGAGGDDRDYSLMIFGIGEAIDLAAIFEAHGDATTARELHDFFGARVLAASRDDDAVDGAAALQGFAHGVDAGEAIGHGAHARRQCTGGCKSVKAWKELSRIGGGT
jgi:hypothetical protein